MNDLSKDLMNVCQRIEQIDGPQVEKDKFRQKFHLMPPVGWMNDPNGLCFFQGKYHVFYQYAPFDAKGGVKFWGHFCSEDLLHWEKCPVFLCPDEVYDVHGVYSGSALVDEGAMYLYYTGNVKNPGDYDYVMQGREQNTILVASEDGMTAGEKQLILKNEDYPEEMTCHVRDPKVWKQDGRYYMVLGGWDRNNKGCVLVYESVDRENWNYINTITTPETFAYMWECPDLFCVDGQYILSVSPQGLKKQGHLYQNQYSCGYFPLYGDFRGEYTLGEYRELDCGFDYYAQQSFEDDKGRRIAIGWMAMPDADYTYTEVEQGGWKHCLGVPRELHWNGKYLTANPVEELRALFDQEEITVCQGETILEGAHEMNFCFYPEKDEDKIVIRFGEAGCFSVENGIAKLELSEKSGAGRNKRLADIGKLKNLQILFDTTSIEIFINDGEQIMSSRYYDLDMKELKICAKGKAIINRFTNSLV